MRDPGAAQLPFIVRDMLAFEGAAAFDLELTTASTVAQVLEITGMTREGPFRFNITTDTSGLAVANVFRIPDLPIFVSVRSSSVLAGVNQVYAMLYLRINGTKNVLLCQGSLGHFYGINWPVQTPPSSLQKRGLMVSGESADAAAGSEFTFDVPAGQFWILKAIHVIYVAAAAAASRRPRLVITFSGGSLIEIPSAATIIISQSSRLVWGEGLPNMDDQVGLQQTMPLPSNLLLPPGTIIESVTTGMNAGDNYSTAQFTAEAFFSAPT